MDDKLKFAALLLAGYLLGRTKKMKLALTIAGAVAGNQLKDESSRAALLGGVGGVKDSLLSSPEIKRLTDEVSGKLMEAGRAAALAAAAKGIDSLNSTLESQTERLKSGRPTDILSQDEDEEPAEDETEEPAEEEAAPPPARRRASTRQKKDAGETEKPARARKAPSRSASTSKSAKPAARKPSGSRTKS